VQGVLPVISRPTVEWETGDGILGDVCHPSWWPADLLTVNPGTLVVVPGQFRCTVEGSGAGTQRLFHRLDLELLTSTSPDRTPPTAGPLELRGVDGGVEIAFPATDASGIGRIVALALRADGSLTSHPVPVPDANAGTYRSVFPGLTADDELVVQVADNAGNVTTLTGRGANQRFLQVHAATPVLAEAGLPTAFTFEVPGWDELTGPVSYLWWFGDGATASGTVEGPTTTVEHSYAPGFGGGTATVRVWDADGSTGTADVEVLALPRCDPTGDVSAGLEWGDFELCRVSSADDRLTFTLSFAAPVSPLGSYRVEVNPSPGSRNPKTVQLRYDPATGQVSGPSSLQVEEAFGGRVLHYRVTTRDLGARGAIEWRASVQAGIPGSPSDGIIDRLPDSGWLSWAPG
jgi:hypothetical protein